MIESNKARWAVVALALLLSLIGMMPNFYRFDEDQWWFSKEKLIYGLDIQGGVYLVMGVKTEEAIDEKIKSLISDVKNTLEKQNLPFESIRMSEDRAGQMEVRLTNLSDKARVQDLIEKEYSASLLGSLSLRVIRTEGVSLFLGYNEMELVRLREDIVDQVVEVLRQRIDEFGVSEPVITAQGKDRVLVQLPGVQDSARARDIIQRTAKLEFRIVNQEMDAARLAGWVRQAEQAGAYSLDRIPYYDYIVKINEDLKDKIPEHQTLVFQKAQGASTLQAGKTPVLVKTDSGATGEILQSAYVGMDEFGRPQVLFNMNRPGQKIFSDLTKANINKPLAIILDKELKSMPVIRSQISDRGSIELGSGPGIQEEAEMIAMVLRTGSLPARLIKMEERTIGPTLGKESIEKGKTAGLVAGVLVLIFMLLYYRTLGMVSGVALGLNILFLLTLLTSLGATLTLPGVAGIILTIGMAVDANVIIYERLREELKKGASLLLAVRDGYRNALSAILDANITTAIVCVVLIFFGTGPIRGFAVTLLCGIVTSLFTAVFVSRTLLNTLIKRFQIKTL